MRQEQFLEVIDRDEAERRFRDGVRCTPRGVESVALVDALGRVLAEDMRSLVDVPSCDRANVDGFAVRASDTFGAFEEDPRRLRLMGATITPGQHPDFTVEAGEAVAIATGAMIPRGADAVVMVEHTDLDGDSVIVRRPVAPGAAISFAGTDVARGELALLRGRTLSSRETGVLAAIGVASVPVFSRPRVAILSTGDEILTPGAPMTPGHFYDSNAIILADAVRELGGEPITMGIAPDEEAAIRKMLIEALAVADLVLASGGTSKGAGDLNAQVLESLPGARILAHGVALKPGKPICLAAVGETPVVILPGFPTSAIFTFHEFVAPVLRMQSGLPAERDTETVEVTLPLRVNSERGRTEYVLVGLVRGEDGLAAYPMGKGSGSVTTFSAADAFVTIPRHTEFLEEGARVQARLLGRRVQPPDLVAVGSHCIGLDALASLMARSGSSLRLLAVGSTGGLLAAQRGECDVAGVHLLDEHTGVYNLPFLDPDLVLVRGYGRMQGVLHRPGDARLDGLADARAALRAALSDEAMVFMNRNRGSGTRILVDRLLAELAGDGEPARPRGFAAEARSHGAVAAAIAAGRADWGVAIETAAQEHGLRFLPLVEERFDFVMPRARTDRAASRAFVDLLRSDSARSALRELGMIVGEDLGDIVPVGGKSP